MSRKYQVWPYGAYLRGNEITWFDRGYRPIVRIGADGVQPCAPDEFIEHSSQRWLYDDGTAPAYDSGTRQKLETLMAAVPEMAAEVRRRVRVRDLPSVSLDVRLAARGC